MYIRPVTIDDHEAVLALAKQAGIGMTSLPADPDVLLKKILLSVKSFAGSPEGPRQERFFFVMVDPATNEVVGTSGMIAFVGLRYPFYSYKLTTITQVCPELNIYTRHELLQVTNDLTGSTEIGSLFLRPDYRRDGLGRFLSLGRFLFMAEFPELFADQLIAEMRGVNDQAGQAPFYNSIARQFFEMEFARADYINATQGNRFIGDLMPKYPIYVSLLPKEARDVIGKPHPQSQAAMVLLEREGFYSRGYLDVFDGGPTLLADRSDIKTIRESRRATVAGVGEPKKGGVMAMLCNDRLQTFRGTVGEVSISSDQAEVELSSETARMLQVEKGGVVRYLPLPKPVRRS